MADTTAHREQAHTHTSPQNTKHQHLQLLRDLSLLATAEFGLKPPNGVEEREFVFDLFTVRVIHVCVFFSPS